MAIIPRWWAKQLDRASKRPRETARQLPQLPLAPARSPIIPRAMANSDAIVSPFNRPKPITQPPIINPQHTYSGTVQTGPSNLNIPDLPSTNINMQMPDTSMYDTLMGYYTNLLNQQQQSSNIPALRPLERPQTYSPELQEYSEDPELASAIARLTGLAETGGYSEDDLGNIRARAISPIRAVYANATRNLDRQRSLAGGYSPNYAAVLARLASGQAGQISEATGNVNAELAEKVASGKMSMAPVLASALERRGAAKRDIEGANVSAKNRAAEFNAGLMDKYRSMLSDRELEQLKLSEASKSRGKELSASIIGQMANLLGAKTDTQLKGKELATRNVQNQQDLALKLAEFKRRGYTDDRDLNLKLKELEQRGGLGLIDAYLRAVRG